MSNENIDIKHRPSKAKIIFQKLIEKDRFGERIIIETGIVNIL